jgi:Fungal specific transcription factor domain/Fungal Zn(2)-Cys(6) binuclear cluster domain
MICRNGCFTCKKRRIKCQETRPSCLNCQRAGFACEYPQHHSQELVPFNPILQPQATPTVFSMTDMRLFHHFLTLGYPHLPVGADEVWTLKIPAFSHEYEFLMHSMLALGASHLELMSNADFKQQALQHRVQAINLLTRALATPIANKTDADARFAAFMALTFQSSCMRDGYMDFLSILRGCVLQGAPLDDESLFANFISHRHLEEMRRRIPTMRMSPPYEREIGPGKSSLAALEPFCIGEVEKQFHTLLSDVVPNAITNPTLGKPCIHLAPLE